MPFNTKFGWPEQNTEFASWYFFHDTLAWGTGETLADKIISDNGSTKDAQYRTELLRDKSLKQNFVIDGIMAEGAIEFDQQNSSEPLQFQMYRFLHYSRIKFEVNNIALAEIPLEAVWPYKLVYTIGGTWNVIAKYQTWLNFTPQTEIKYPYGGNCEITFKPAKNIVAKTGTTALGYLTGQTGNSNVASSEGWSIDFYFRCRQVIVTGG